MSKLRKWKNKVGRRKKTEKRASQGKKVDLEKKRKQSMKYVGNPTDTYGVKKRK